MIDSNSEITPILMLPGVALLILSTSIRFNRLHDELHHSIVKILDPKVLEDLVRRAYLFHKALVKLYTCVALFSLSGFINIVVGRWYFADLTSCILIGLGITTLFGASLYLVKESRLSLNIINSHKNYLSNSHS